ncbi:MAG: proprotein convertase P-domain-containing protein, partial [Deltaproteobacteria bacterium]|nr:proprotein convertase P-domain-containing protein [Deltaproteobacteria bacterium]
EPPATALSAQRYSLPRGRWVSSRVRSIKAHMFDNHTAVLVGGTFYYQSWNHRRSTLPTNQDNWRQGIVLPPNDEDRRVSLEKRAGHAFVLVGWDDNMEVQQRDAMGNGVVDAMGQPVMERGFFIFKNSWGTGSFGINNPHGAGFGFIAYRYVEELSANVSGLPTPPRPREACGNGTDDDGDSASDCADSDCAMDPACMTTGGPSTYRSTQVMDIPDNTAAGIRSDLQVTDAGAARGLRVTVEITHPYRGDLRVALVRNGSEAVLLDEQGGGEDDVRQTFTVDRFLGEDAQGTWTLLVVDGAAQDVGVLRSWSLEVAR